MKKLFIFIVTYLVCLLLISCNKKYDSLYHNAPGPALRFNRDTMILREKNQTNILRNEAGKLVVYCGEVAHQLNLQLGDPGGKVHFVYRGIEILPTDFLPVIDSVLLFVYADTAGLFPVDCYLTDQLGKINKKTLFVLSFPNQKPVADFFSVLTNDSHPQKWAFWFDGSNSSDPDGKIVEYHYSVNGQPINVNQPACSWVFHAKGVHDIGLYVTDDLGLSSDTIQHQITIQ